MMQKIQNNTLPLHQIGKNLPASLQVNGFTAKVVDGKIAPQVTGIPKSQSFMGHLRSKKADFSLVLPNPKQYCSVKEIK